MTPTALVADLLGRGFDLTAAGGRLRVRPASALTPADRAALAAEYRAVIRVLDAVAAARAARPDAPVWAVVASSDPAAVGGVWVGDVWCPPPVDTPGRVCDNRHNGDPGDDDRGTPPGDPRERTTHAADCGGHRHPAGEPDPVRPR